MRWGIIDNLLLLMSSKNEAKSDLSIKFRPSLRIRWLIRKGGDVECRDKVAGKIFQIKEKVSCFRNVGS